MILNKNTSQINNKPLNSDPSKELSIVSFIVDLPNICTLFGLLSSTIGIYFAITGKLNFAIIGGVWAVLFDWLDGLIASKLKNRTGKHREFGAQLDSLIDIVSFGVLPAIILLSYSGFSPWFLPGAFIIVAAAAIRLSYFNIYGLSAGKKYTGLPVDNNGLLVAFAFLFESYISAGIFSIGLHVLLMVVVLFNLSSLQIPKFSKKAIYGIAAYVIFVSIFLGI
jgi:phosphatidylserine synthase